MMFVPFETQVSMLGIVKKYNGFTVSSTLTTEAQSNTTPANKKVLI
jgi:hypothetical protein